MASVINTNVASLVAQRNLNGAQNNLTTSVQRLSSGFRINSGKDDAAGLAIVQKMASQARSMSVASRNANDGVSMIQTAEGAASAVNDIFLRMRELATQASNDSLASTQRDHINTELGQLQTEAENIVGKTKFNTQNLLTGGFNVGLAASSGVVGGAAAGSVSGVTSVDVSGAKASSTYTFSATGTSLKLSDTAGNSQTITVAVGTQGGAQTLNFGNMGVKVNLGYSAAEAASLTALGLDTKAAVTTSSSGAELLVGADNASNNKMTLSFTDLRLSGGSTQEFTDLTTSLTTYSGSKTRANANDLMDKLDSAITKLSEERAKFGAWQNRLDFTTQSLGTAEENVRASMSRIQDTDYAQETANLTKGQIMQQAGAAMLSQANQMPNVILSLLK